MDILEQTRRGWSAIDESRKSRQYSRKLEMSCEVKFDVIQIGERKKFSFKIDAIEIKLSCYYNSNDIAF